MTKRTYLFVAGSMMLLFALAACRGRGLTPDDLPTVIPSIEEMATSVVLTENAPPPGYRDAVAFGRVDQNLRELEGWRYVMLLEFEGAFSQTNRPTEARAEATVWYNQIGSARRVIVDSSGELLQRPEGEVYEAVQLGPDAFLVRGSNCLSNVEDDAEVAAGITAGDLVGGVRTALPNGQTETINGVQAWAYSFLADDLNLPPVRFAEDTGVTMVSGEMWIAPEYDAVVRYWVTLDIANARLFDNDLPVSGQLRLRFDLYDVGDVPNISVPFGC